MSKKIAYLGKDLGYWDDLQKVYAKTYPTEEKSFHQFSYHANNINDCIFELFELAPSIIYIDIKDGEVDGHNLGLILKRIHFFRHTPVVAIVSNVEDVKKLISINFDFVFVKGIEIHDVVYHPYKLRFPAEAISAEFALAKLQAEIKLKEIARVGYYGLSSMHIECNNKLEEGSIVEVEHALENKQMDTNYFVARKHGEDNIYYGSNGWSELEYLFVDPVKREDGSLSLNVEDLNENELSRKLKIGKTLKKWVNDNSSYGSKKLTKLFMIDPQMNYFKSNDKLIDTYDFVFRINESFDEDYINIARLNPDIIVYSYPELLSEDGEFEDAKEGQDVDQMANITKNIEDFHQRQDEILKNAVSNIKKLGDNSPYFIVINCDRYSSKEFQEKFNYQFALVNPTMIGMNVLSQMVHQLEEKRLTKEEQELNTKIAALRKKDPIKYAKLNKSYFNPPKYFVSKKSPLSHALIIRDAKLVEISESTCFFTLNEELVVGNYYLTHPFNFAVKIVPQEGNIYKKEGNTYKYQGLIHAIGEKEKMRLRQFVNDIYTQHKKEIREKEALVMKEANERFLEEQRIATLSEEEAAAEEEAQEQAAKEEKLKNTAPENMDLLNDLDAAITKKSGQ
ncbi:hypothetical protein M902_3179 [Bacteriovorax sp. BAL6_X]|uniref:hypothetical protein n=1 Tax=Bacteriovorax sp. BAL6_X TaxID=1201290 RepID=UPI0003863A5D|nr:hypothetical protein [Bacteriovorax sp. BAL6_X]EPZ50635.1 hypothetical protein M902_3179 [Bacteriovorax sp. BAL6_X]